MRVLDLAALSALMTCSALASPIATLDDELAAAAAAAREEAQAPGIGMMLALPGSEPVIVVDGVRLAGQETAVAAGDAWHWGSITKSMTATLVARLVEKEVVSWDDSIGELLSEAVPVMHPSYADVTFLHLLSHRSGLPANIPFDRFGDFAGEPEDRVEDRLEWVRIALTQEPVAGIEEKFEYSNNGFIVAGAMLEAATGEPWEALMEREVFEPLGMKGAGFGAPQGERPDAQPSGHTPGANGDQPVPPGADNPPALGPAGRVHMPLADMARYLQAHAQGDTEFLSAESYAKLHTAPFGGEYALGWIVNAEKRGWHNGSNTMWYAEATFDPVSGVVVAVVVNDGDLGTVTPVVSKLLLDVLADAKNDAQDE